MSSNRTGRKTNYLNMYDIDYSKIKRKQIEKWIFICLEPIANHPKIFMLCI